MTLAEKFATLTPAQQEKLKTLKDSAEFDAFVSETGLELTDKEKASVLSLVETGIVKLTDEQLDDVAGGKSWGLILSLALQLTETIISVVEKEL